MSHTHDHHLELSPDDKRLLDLLLEHDFDPEAIGPLGETDRARADALIDLFGLLNDYPVEDPEDTLIHATLARVDRAESERAVRMTVDPGRARTRGLAGRLPDFITVAAVLLIGVSVVWPLSNMVRRHGIDTGCAQNMRVLGGAFAAYAAEYNNAMPVVQAGLGTGGWEEFRNVLHLMPLMEYGYCDEAHFDCPGHRDHDRYSASYSYRWQDPARLQTWGTGPRTVILGDRNPVVDAALAGRVVPALSVSINHGGRGQNVLQSDASVEWLDEPRFGRDNIWLPDGYTKLEAGLRPRDPADTFLTH
ncbi:MAG: hypothetical protein ACYTGG_03255 [Planctomycetota bacterium]|jgi:hypothetical protein